MKAEQVVALMPEIQTLSVHSSSGSSTTLKGQYLHHKFISILKKSHQLCGIELSQSKHNAEEYKSVPNKETARI